MSRLALYRTARSLLPQRLLEAIGGSSLTRALRDRFFRPGGDPLLVSGAVRWMDLDFTLTAPIQVLERAQRRGVENRICRVIRACLGPGDLALDVGANYGFITTVMAKTVAPGGRVLSFEIVPAVQEAIRRTLRRNGHESIVELVAKGAGARDDAGMVTIDAVLENACRADVPSQERTPRLIKVDVDGGDLDVLIGARKTLEQHHPIVIIEMTEQQEEIFELLVEAGYKHFIDQSNRPVTRGEWPENLIASIEPVRVPFPA